MTQQKVIITKDVKEINALLEKGWKVVSVTAQHISHAATFALTGEFCFVLEKWLSHSSSSTTEPNPYLGPEV